MSIDDRIITLSNTIQTIGEMVINTVNEDMDKNTRGNYCMYDYIVDFEGTQEEFNIKLIKWAAKLL